MISFFQIKTWREEQVYGCTYRACLACWTTIVIFCETELHQVTVAGSLCARCGLGVHGTLA